MIGKFFLIIVLLQISLGAYIDLGEYPVFYDIANILSTETTPDRYLDFDVPFNFIFPSVPRVVVSMV